MESPYPDRLDVDGLRDPKNSAIVYWGKAVRVKGNVYRCYANVAGALCVVKITATVLPEGRYGVLLYGEDPFGD